MIKIVCDRCGKDIEEQSDIGYIAWNFRRGIEGNLILDNMFEGNHFCKQCMQEIRDFIQSLPEKQPENTIPEEGNSTSTTAENVIDKLETVTEKLETVIEKPETVTEEPETVPKNDENVSEKPETTGPKTIEKSTEPKKKSKTRIDIGKIMALRAAGWDNIKIADEMGMEPHAVANAICRYKKKQKEISSALDMDKLLDAGESASEG